MTPQPRHRKAARARIAIAAARGGIAIAGSLGPFKKGAIHVAMHAGVPIVPIGSRNAGELM